MIHAYISHHGSGAAVLSSCSFGCCRVVFFGGLLWNWGIEIREYRDPPGRADMATEQITQMFEQFQQLSQQLVNQQQTFQQSLEMQRQQSQAQTETLSNLGVAQVCKTTYDARDPQTKAFTKMKGFKCDERVGQIGGASFVSRLRGVSVKRHRFGMGLRTGTINRFLSQTPNKLLQGRIGLTWQISTCRIGAFASKYQPQPCEGEDDRWREWARDDFFGGALAEIYEHLEGHRNDSATIIDLALTTLRFDAGLIRNIATKLCDVLILLTRGRAQRLVLKAAEPEGLEAYRLLRRYEQTSTVTTVSKPVDLLATTFSGDFTGSLTDLEGRVTSWEQHDMKRNIVKCDQNRSCHERFGGREGFRRSLVDQHCRHDRVGEICERDRKR